MFRSINKNINFKLPTVILRPVIYEAFLANSCISLLTLCKISGSRSKILVQVENFFV